MSAIDRVSACIEADSQSPDIKQHLHMDDLKSLLADARRYRDWQHLEQTGNIADALAALAARVATSEDALAQCIDDFGDGHSVCPATKAQTIAAMSGNPDGSFDAMRNQVCALTAEVKKVCEDNERLGLENARLRDLLNCAASDLIDWGNDVPEYFRRKHNLNGDIEIYRAASKEKS